MLRLRVLVAFVLSAAALGGPSRADGPLGYYRQPTLNGDTIVFVAEGDLWTCAADGGVARRLTSHPAEEQFPALSPDGRTVAFVAGYEGPDEVYTMPVAGGRPVRRTYGVGRLSVVGWTPSGELLYATSGYSTLPSRQLVRLDVTRDDVTGSETIVPLAQAADGWYDDAGTLFFTRLPFQGSHTKRYKGGTAQNIWRFHEGDDEAVPLTPDYPGTSRRPMWWKGRVYFASDRDGTMNIWSMDPTGGDLRRHTRHEGWDVASPFLQDGRIVYQLGADLHRYDIAADRDQTLTITLETDLDQTREHWIEKPMDYLTAAHISPDGDRVVLTARGRVFVAPHRQGRLVEVTRREGVRYRRARFLPGGDRLVCLSDESGEVEVWTLPANGVGDAEQVTEGAEVLRWDAVPSPDGRWIAHYDKNLRLYLDDLETHTDRLIDESTIDDFRDLAWSPDSAWLAYVTPADNMFATIRVYSIADGAVTAATSDRFDSSSPAWSPDGKWLYFLSDRNLESVVGSPWGSYQPEPFLDKRTEIFQLALRTGLRSPFAPRDELHPEEKKKGEKEEDTKEETKEEKPEKPEEPEEQDGDQSEKQEPAAAEEQPAGAEKSAAGESSDKKVEVTIEPEGLPERLLKVPVPAGNYSSLSVNDGALFWQQRDAGAKDSSLQAAKITNIDLEVKTVADKIDGYELTQDGKKLMLRRKDALHIVEAKPEPAKLEKSEVDLSAWRLSVEPREEWRQMFVESWRLERDYFYDRAMHGVDWPAMLKKYLPLVDRVTSREELGDLMGQMVSELAALHIFVLNGDVRSGPDDVPDSSLGALLRRDEDGGGYRVEHVYRSDPDQPERRSPLARPGVDVGEGDVIEAINGAPALSLPDVGAVLRRQAGRQVLLRVRPAAGGEPRDVIVEPISLGKARDLRYHEWEYTRRLEVEQMGEGEIGYVHLRAMGGGNFTEWARDFYPVFNRKGLIIDVRNNTGGNIDSWIIGRLLRRAWFYWSQRVGRSPAWNMQYAFRGHVAVLCNERTASDGEAFTEGVKRLDLAKVFGTRTWGGEIWLSFSNRLVDKGIASAAEAGVYGPDGDWLIEGWGVEPDVTIDNLPHATFLGKDAQLETAIQYLQERIREQPVPDVPPPAYPNKSSSDNN